MVLLSEREINGIGKLGFGLMRLPRREDGAMDIGQIMEMTDLFLEKGFNYFDTAFVYDGGLSEEAARDALPEGKHRRALDYICRHEGAVLCFGGKDAVRPAILEAVELMAKRKEEAAC